MNGRQSGLWPRGRRKWTLLAGAELVAAVTAAWSSSSSSSSAPTTATNSGGSANAKCGTTVPVGPSNPTGIYASLPANLKAIYSSFPGELIASPWATTKITAKPPWKIGFIPFALNNQYNDHLLTHLHPQFPAPNH